VKIVNIYLTPFIPLSFKGEGEEIEREAQSPSWMPCGIIRMRS